MADLAIADLIAIFRSDLSDPELPGSGDDTDSLWLDADITRWIYRAQKELCEQVDLLYDRTSFDIDTADGTDLYAIDDTITKVRRGVGADGRKIPALSIAELERRYSDDDLGWETTEWEDKTGEPKYFITDYAVGYLRAVPIPDAIENITLDVYRLPTVDTLEIPNKYREKLLNKAKSLAYLVDDVDVQNLPKAAAFETLWKADIADIDKLFKRRNRGPQVVAYAGL